MATYTPSQLYLFYDRIRLPSSQRRTTIATLTPFAQLTYLTTLTQRSLLYIPFEDLCLHYSTSASISTDPDALFDKYLSQSGDATLPQGRGRGGYCMENNALLGIVLRSLGFECWSVGGRGFDKEGLTGFGHMINLVTVGGDVYAVDVEFGSGPIKPVKLPSEAEIREKGHGESAGMIEGSEMKIVWDDPHVVDEARFASDHDRINHPPSAAETSADALSYLKPQRKCYILQSRRTDKNPQRDDGQWNRTPLYAFVTQYFAPKDYAVMNWCVGAHEISEEGCAVWRFLEGLADAPRRSEVDGGLDQDGGGKHGNDDRPAAAANMLAKHSGRKGDESGGVELVGQVILTGKTLKIRIENENFVVASPFQSEDERIEALKRYFGLHLRPQEVRGIKGMMTAI